MFEGLISVEATG